MSLKKIFFALIFFVLIVPVFGQADNQHQGCLDSLKIPTILTPENCHGENLSFAIDFPCAPQNFEIAIYNRWGEEIFASTNPNFEWLGIGANGNKMNDGVYVYGLRYTYLNEEKNLTGQITLIR